MKKILLSLSAVLFLFSVSAFADEACYSLSRDGKAWSQTPELLCINGENNAQNSWTITLKSGAAFNLQTVATLNLNLTRRARPTDNNHANQDVFEIANPSNSVFNKLLLIKFKGTHNAETGREEGTVLIGGKKFYYRSQ